MSTLQPPNSRPPETSAVSLSAGTTSNSSVAGGGPQGRPVGAVPSGGPVNAPATPTHNPAGHAGGGAVAAQAAYPPGTGAPAITPQPQFAAPAVAAGHPVAGVPIHSTAHLSQAPAAGALPLSAPRPAIPGMVPGLATASHPPVAASQPPQSVPQQLRSGTSSASAGTTHMPGPLATPSRFVPYFDVLRKRRESWSNFPSGLRVLVADNDPASLQVVERMLKKCGYTVTLCSSGKNSLEILRKRREEFDIVLADVNLPDIDGFKLLSVCCNELSLPVVLMSNLSETSAVMRGVVEGARDFMIKPLRVEELKIMWQHVVRYTSELTKTDCQPGSDVADVSRMLPELAGTISGKDTLDKDSDSTSSKKQRVIWSVEMHQQFVNAVNQLGIEKAVPKRILDLMNVEGLTRENVASHLQKYRLYLKRMANSQDSPSASMGLEGLVSDGSFPGVMMAVPQQMQASPSGAVPGASPVQYIQQPVPASASMPMQMPSPMAAPPHSQVSVMQNGQLHIPAQQMMQVQHGAHMLVMPQGMGPPRPGMPPGTPHAMGMVAGGMPQHLMHVQQQHGMVQNPDAMSGVKRDAPGEADGQRYQRMMPHMQPNGQYMMQEAVPMGMHMQMSHGGMPMGAPVEYAQYNPSHMGSWGMPSQQ